MVAFHPQFTIMPNLFWILCDFSDLKRDLTVAPAPRCCHMQSLCALEEGWVLASAVHRCCVRSPVYDTANCLHPLGPECVLQM